MFDWLATRWSTFWYNFSWDDYVPFLNGYAAKASLFVPLIGYAVIFNDYVAEKIEFSQLTNEVRSTFFLQSDSRIRFVFLGFLALSISNLLYRAMRPHAIKIGESEAEYTEHFLRYATAGTFQRLHLLIKKSDYDPWTPDGKYYDDDWDLFWREATWQRSGRNELIKEDFSQRLPGYDNVSFSDAKKRHESLLLSILRETYFRESRSRRPQLLICIFIATLGYILLLVPSLDLVLRVLEITIFDPLVQILGPQA